MNISFQKNDGETKKIFGIRLRSNYALTQTSQMQDLLHSINETKKEINNLSELFNYATDDCLIDMYAYQIKAVEKKYSYYLSKAKELRICSKEYIGI